MKKMILITLFPLFFGIYLNAGVSHDFNKPIIMEQSEEACEEVDVTECIRLGMTYAIGTNEIDVDMNMAMVYTNMSCNYGSARACLVLKMDKLDKTKKSLKKLCDDGDKKACNELKHLNVHKDYVVDGKCPNCNSIHIAKYLYGLPNFTKELKEKINKGEVILGGCIISGNDPKYQCMNCGLDLYQKLLIKILQKRIINEYI